MTLFRRRKKGEAPREDKLNYPSSKSLKEDILQGQVDNLQEEMKRLNERLLEMQSNVQNTGNILHPSTAINVPIPSISQRSSSQNKTQLSTDQCLRNKSIRKKKGMEDVFVPCEIDFVSNDSTLDKGQVIHRPKIFEDEPPIREIETTKPFVVDKPQSINKTKTGHQPSSQIVGDAESTASSQRSSVSMKNGRKVRRIVRKVRAVPPPKSTPKTVNSASKDVAPKRGLLEDIRSGVKLNTVKQSREQNLPSKPDFSQGDSRKVSQQIRQDAPTANSVEYRASGAPKTTSKNPRNSLLEGIKAGIELKKADRTTESSQKDVPTPKSSLLEGIKAGVKLKQVDRSAEKPRMVSRDPKSALLEGIKAGVKLKQVDRSLQEKKKKETPMSALLANIQKRKQECLRQQEQQCVDNGIDW